MTSSTRARLLIIDPYDNTPPHMLASISHVEVLPVECAYNLHGREDGSVTYLYGSAWAADQSRMLDLFYASGVPNKEKSIRYFEAMSLQKCPYEGLMLVPME